MSRFASGLAPTIETFLEYREALGYVTRHFVTVLTNLDRFVVSNYPELKTLTKELVKWLESGADLNAKLPYLRAYMGHESFDETHYYVHLLPDNFVTAAGVGWDELGALVPEVVRW